MQVYQDRVITEQRELEYRLDKLHEFIARDFFKTLPEREQDRLLQQAFHMDAYNAILKQRIEAFV